MNAAPSPLPPYALPSGKGRTFRQGIPFTIKAGELSPGRGVAVMEYTTRRGEEPPDHTHPTEDEIFYVLAGSLTFHCGGRKFELGEGGMVYLPLGIEHGYTITSEDEVRLLAITCPARPGTAGGWGGFVADLEQQGEWIPET